MCRNITCREDHFATSEDNTILYYVPTTTCHVILNSYIKKKKKSYFNGTLIKVIIYKLFKGSYDITFIENIKNR